MEIVFKNVIKQNVEKRWYRIKLLKQNTNQNWNRKEIC